MTPSQPNKRRLLSAKPLLGIGQLTLFLTLMACGDAQKDESGAQPAHAYTDKPATPPLLESLNTSELGIDFQHDAGFSDQYAIYEPLGSGVAVIDIDNDGRMDLFFPQYGSTGTSSGLYRNLSEKDALQFAKITPPNHTKGGDTSLTSQRGLIFAAVADANNDGWEDILTGGHNRLQLWINQGHGHFRNSGWLSAPAEESFFTSASWFDANGDGWLDVWVTNYVDGSKDVDCRLANGAPGYCPPSAYRDRVDWFFLNNQGAGLQTSPAPAITPRASLGVVTADFDNNGWPDVYIANDQQNNQLFFNQSGQLLADEAMRRGAAFNLMGQVEASMGIAVGDMDNNGFNDLYVTHYQAETNTLYLNQSGHFTDKTAQAGLTAAVRPFTGFGTAFLDLNGDNRLDLVVVNGSVVTTEKGYGEESNGRLHTEPVQVWLDHNGALQYQQQLARQLPKRVGRGLVPVDLDNDGDKDLVISNNNQPPTVLRNNSNPDHWLGLDLRCHGRTALGAKLQWRTADGITTYRHVHSDGSYASSQDTRVLFYPSEQSATIEIFWPEGQHTQLSAETLAPNRYHRIECPPLPQQAAS